MKATSEPDMYQPVPARYIKQAPVAIRHTISVEIRVAV